MGRKPRALCLLNSTYLAAILLFCIIKQGSVLCVGATLPPSSSHNIVTASELDAGQLFTLHTPALQKRRRLLFSLEGNKHTGLGVVSLTAGSTVGEDVATLTGLHTVV